MADLTPERGAEWRKDAEYYAAPPAFTANPLLQERARRILALLDALRDERTAREKADIEWMRISEAAAHQRDEAHAEVAQLQSNCTILGNGSRALAHQRDEARRELADLRARIEPITQYVRDLKAFYSDDEDPHPGDVIDHPTGGPDPDYAPLRWSDLCALSPTDPTKEG